MTEWIKVEEWGNPIIVVEEDMEEHGLEELVKERQKAGVKDNGDGTASFTGKLIGMGF